MRLRQRFLGPKPGAVRFDPNVDDIPWVIEGLLAGLLGATVIAVFFLLLDVLAGRPLWTPNALGAALILRAVPGPDAPIQPVLVAAYTLLHGSVFTIVGLAAARELFTGSRIPGTRPWLRSLLLAGALFVLFELSTLAFGAFVEPAMQQAVGVWRVSLANLLAAIAMATVLRARGERLGLHPPPAP